MEKTLLLDFPTASLISPFAERVQAHTTQWALQFELISEEKVPFFDKAKFGWYAAREYPEASYAEICIVGDLIAWLFTVDDKCDRASSNSTAAATLKAMFEGFIHIIRQEGRLYSMEHRILNRSLENIMHRFEAVSNPALFRAFGEEMISYFEECLWEVDMQLEEHEPNIKEYLQWRPKTGFYIMFPLISIFHQLDIPREVYQHPNLKQAELLLNLTANLANDLHSMEREKALKTKGLNLVFIYERELHLSLEEAVDKIYDEYFRNLDTIDQLLTGMPSYGAAIDRQLKIYIDGLYTVIKAYFDWALVDTTRYKSGH